MLHERNPHAGKYDFPALCKVYPALQPFVSVNAYGTQTIDFSDPEAVKALNKALLRMFYQIKEWDIPAGYLCPPIPGRAEYIHRVADLVEGKTDIRVLDVGVGANAIYPIIGIREYGWNFVASDIDQKALENAEKIIVENPSLKDKAEFRFQPNAKHIFEGVLSPYEYFHLVICNPPFHASPEEAMSATQRKRKNLGIADKKPLRNFGGQSNELWCDGGEEAFIHQMIAESAHFKARVGWFTTLVSKETTLKGMFKALKKVQAKEVKKLEYGIGQKTTRVVAWHF